MHTQVWTPVRLYKRQMLLTVEKESVIEWINPAYLSLEKIYVDGMVMKTERFFQDL
jgi:hypothetical protein